VNDVSESSRYAPFCPRISWRKRGARRRKRPARGAVGRKFESICACTRRSQLSRAAELMTTQLARFSRQPRCSRHRKRCLRSDVQCRSSSGSKMVERGSAAPSPTTRKACETCCATCPHRGSGRGQLSPPLQADAATVATEGVRPSSRLVCPCSARDFEPQPLRRC
jgi:hypothetical protein